VVLGHAFGTSVWALFRGERRCAFDVPERRGENGKRSFSGGVVQAVMELSVFLVEPMPSPDARARYRHWSDYDKDTGGLP
jgi:hypothetical protein